MARTAAELLSTLPEEERQQVRLVGKLRQTLPEPGDGGAAGGGSPPPPQDPFPKVC
jgi:hypothetical protein